jgi:hypothetical protein
MARKLTGFRKGFAAAPAAKPTGLHLWLRLRGEDVERGLKTVAERLAVQGA